MMPLHPIVGKRFGRRAIVLVMRNDLLYETWNMIDIGRHQSDTSNGNSASELPSRGKKCQADTLDFNCLVETPIMPIMSFVWGGSSCMILLNPDRALLVSNSGLMLLNDGTATSTR